MKTVVPLLVMLVLLLAEFSIAQELWIKTVDSLKRAPEKAKGLEQDLEKLFRSDEAPMAGVYRLKERGIEAVGRPRSEPAN